MNPRPPYLLAGILFVTLALLPAPSRSQVRPRGRVRAAEATAPRYTVVEVTFPGDPPGRTFIPAGLNNVGQVVGRQLSNVADDSVPIPIVWKDGQRRVLNGLADPAHSYPVGINDFGQVLLDNYFIGQAVIWRDGAVRTLSHPGSDGLTPLAINNLGAVCGTAHISGTNDSRPWLWKETGSSLLSDGVGNGFGLNDAGVVVGDDLSNASSVFAVPALWKNGAITFLFLNPDLPGV